MTKVQFPPEVRLRQSKEFRTVFRRGRRFVRSGLVVIAVPTTHDTARLGMTLAKRRIPRAVDRNRVKRTIRESFRHGRAGIGAVDIVVLAREGAADMSNKALSSQLRSVWLEMDERQGGGSCTTQSEIP